MARTSKTQLRAVNQSVMRFKPNTDKLKAELKDKRHFRGVAYNGGLMFPTLTAGGRTITGAVVVDLASFRIPSENRPVLDGHDESTDGLIGRTVSVKIDQGSIVVNGFLYPKKFRAQKILSANDAGKSWQLSIGADNFVYEEVPAGRPVWVNSQRFNGPLTVLRNGYLTDISFVEIGGDGTTWATIDAHRKTNPARPTSGDVASSKQLARLTVDSIVTASMAEDRRIAAIRFLSKGDHKLESVAIERGWTVDEFDMKAMAYGITGR
ncbi:MAG: hypothetical protein WCH39_22345 [Schlesneria sp.]